MARSRKVAPPPLPRVFLQRRAVRARATMMRHTDGSEEYEVIARKTRSGPVLKRWPWWAADKPRKRTARFMVLDNVRYQVEFIGA